ncbi:MAG: right-handed parallel beta-helix repeat-containing protein [Phycisphaerales bacterium]|nr:right-handed parallel beta-helix repeat-containing protein [Phycisphaerales bacterium]
MTSRWSRWAPAGAALVIVATGWLFAGPLDPPAGLIAPTPGPEPRIAINATNTPGDADSVFHIGQPGSYYLEGNVTGEAAKHGIEIVASGVTIDLNGFDLIGVPESLQGIRVGSSIYSNVSVQNGSVRDWGGAGVLLGGRNSAVDRVRSSNNGSHGIAALSGTITDCAVYDNTGNGILFTFTGAVANCSAEHNSGNGIVVSHSGAVTNCTADQNDGDGFNLGTSLGNAGGSTISHCSASLNLGNGMALGTGCTAESCSLFANRLDGILLEASCRIVGNACQQSGYLGGTGAGVHATGTDNRIESNNCAGGDLGIKVDAASNFIVRNSCSGNATNWDIAAGNVCFVVVGATAPAIFGAAGGTPPGSIDPNANFSY